MKMEQGQNKPDEIFSCTRIAEFQNYLHQEERSRNTITKYIRDLKVFFTFLDGQPMDKEALLDWKKHLTQTHAPASVNSMLAALNQFLEFCGYGQMKVRRVKTQKNLFRQEEKELTAKEYRRLVRAARSAGKIQLALIMEAIAVTGVRVSELRYFTVEQVKRGRIEVRNKGKYRRIFLTTDIRKKLLCFAKFRKIIKGCVFVTNSGKPKDRSNLWSEMKALKEKAGVKGEKIFPHNLRHLFARVYYQTTKDMAGLADVLGHSSLNVTRIYTSSTGEIYQRQLERLTILQI